MGRYDRTVEERFSEKFIVDAATGCWLWTACKNPDGYGYFRVAGRTREAHRWSWEQRRGVIPRGMEIDHLCRVRHCVNPSHLEPVPHVVNVRRSDPATKTHCRNGHLLDEANTYQRPSGQRTCRACNRASVAALKARKAVQS